MECGRDEKRETGFRVCRCQIAGTDCKMDLLFGVQELGRGSITIWHDDVLFRSFWENGKLMFSNAVFLGWSIEYFYKNDKRGEYNFTPFRFICDGLFRSN